MEYVKLGKTGRTVSRIGYGGATAGLKNYLHSFDPRNPEDRRKVLGAIEKALEMGITYFDTAPGYGNGESEEMFGEVLQGMEDKIFLATKVSFNTYDGVHRSVEASLKRLKRDYVDLLQIHGTSYTDEQADQIMGTGGMLEAMYELKECGMVRHIGFTSEDNNAAVYRFISSGSFYEAEKKEMGIVTMRAPTSGTFQRWIKMVNPENTFDYNRALIQFVLSNPLVDVALIGMRSAERVMQNVEICNDKARRISLDKVHERYV